MINSSVLEAAFRNDARPCLTSRGRASLIAFRTECEMIKIARTAAFRALGIRTEI